MPSVNYLHAVIYIFIYYIKILSLPYLPYCCTAVHQVFTRSLRTYSVPIILILSLLYCCIAPHYNLGIHALTLSMPIASILSPSHSYITDYCMSGIYALTQCQLHQSCQRCTIVPLYRYTTTPTYVK